MIKSHLIWSRDQPDLYLHAIYIQKWYLICYISIWDQFKLFKLSILGCLGDIDNASLSKWRYEKKFTWFLNISHLLFVKHRNCVWKFKSIDICNYMYFKEKKTSKLNSPKRKYEYCLQNERSCDTIAIWCCCHRQETRSKCLSKNSMKWRNRENNGVYIVYLFVNPSASWNLTCM